MRYLKKILALAIAVCLTGMGMAPITAKAAEDEYTYTIRFYAGTKGKHKGGQEVIIHKNLHYGDQVTFDPRREVELQDKKYYIRGIRESGKDNNTAVTSESPSFKVTGDQDYVVTYGVLGDSVAYEVRFQDENGNPLADTETYYGNVGDRPVVAYLYIENYQPQALAITGTLQRDASKNVFTFVYTRISREAQQAVQEALNPVTPAPTTMTTPTAMPGTPEEPTPPGEEVISPDPEVPRDPGDVVNPIINEIDNNPPEEIIENTDDQVPLADQDLGGAVMANDFAKVLVKLPLAAKVGICSAVFLLGGAGGFMLTRRKRKVKYAKPEE